MNSKIIFGGLLVLGAAVFGWTQFSGGISEVSQGSLRTDATHASQEGQRGDDGAANLSVPTTATTQLPVAPAAAKEEIPSAPPRRRSASEDVAATPDSDTIEVSVEPATNDVDASVADMADLFDDEPTLPVSINRSGTEAQVDLEVNLSDGDTERYSDTAQVDADTRGNAVETLQSSDESNLESGESFESNPFESEESFELETNGSEPATAEDAVAEDADWKSIDDDSSEETGTSDQTSTPTDDYEFAGSEFDNEPVADGSQAFEGEVAAEPQTVEEKVSSNQKSESEATQQQQQFETANVGLSRLHNPTEYVVAFVVSGVERRLNPGETTELAPGVVRFHRGGAFDDTEATLEAGHNYKFSVTRANGWRIETVKPNQVGTTDRN